ncbi:MAG: hypothetical protein VX278_14800, partial [Myxococcota bacterium]|nr:hypothetical protein [Myxococcota bacterium]
MLHITVREPCEAKELVSHHLSPENVDAVFDAGLVWVSNARVSDPKKALATGTVLKLRIPEEVYNHKGILVINKP